MKKLALLAFAATGVLALAGTAQAKEIASMKVCGASGCNTVTDAAQLKGWEGDGSLYPEEVLAPGAQPFFTIDLGFGDGSGNVIHHETVYWLPAGKVMRFQPAQSPWVKTSAAQEAMYEKAAAGLTGFVPRLAKVRVKGRTAADPDSYMRLFDRYPYVSLPRSAKHMISIVLTPSGVNPFVPWNGKTTLRYDSKRRVLIRQDGYVRLPRELARLVMHRASLRAETSSGSGGGTALYAGIGVGALAAVAVLAVARHKKMT